MNIRSEVEKNSPLILATFGVIGFVTATVMSAKVTPMATQVLKKLPRDATHVEKARILAPIYAPTAGMLLISTACIVASSRLYKQRYLSLLALYSIGEQTLKKWQESIIEEVGPKKAEKVRERVVAPVGPIPKHLGISDNVTLFYDDWSGRYFEVRSIEVIRQIVNDLNETLLIEDFVVLNDFYYLLELPPVQIGDSVGWAVMNGNIEIVYDSKIHDDRPCISISFRVDPKEY